MRVCLDTNVLAYAEGANDLGRRDVAVGLIGKLSPGDTIVPAQVLGELFNVLVRKVGRSRNQARDAILAWRDVFVIAETRAETMALAADLSADHGLSIWDAVILTVASQAGCRLLLSEDLQDGFTWGGVTVANPFALQRHGLLDALLGDEP